MHHVHHWSFIHQRALHHTVHPSLVFSTPYTINIASSYYCMCGISWYDIMIYITHSSYLLDIYVMIKSLDPRYYMRCHPPIMVCIHLSMHPLYLVLIDQHFPSLSCPCIALSQLIPDNSLITSLLPWSAINFQLYQTTILACRWWHTLWAINLSLLSSNVISIIIYGYNITSLLLPCQSTHIIITLRPPHYLMH